jgi:Flp pilus assembly protein TadG
MLNTSSYRPALTRLAADERGVTGIVAAIAATVLLGFCGLAVDVIMWQVQQRTMQGAADQAALAAATAYKNAGETVALGDSTAGPNGAYATALANTSNWPGAAPTFTVAAYNNGSSCTNDGCVKVTITQRQQRYFTAIFSTDAVNASASAVGTCKGCGNGSSAGGSNGGDPCVMALDSSGKGVITDTGGGTLNLTNCNLYNNAPNTDATIVNNNGVIEGCSSTTTSATCSAKAFLAQPNNPGGIDIPVTTNAAPAPDPYANLTPPTVGSCLTWPNPPTNIPTGTYCPGNINGQTVSFQTGAVIVLKPPTSGGGQNGPGLDATGNSATSLTGTNVILYVLGGAKLTANSTINLSAPTTGTYAGVGVWFGDSSAVTWNGGNNSTFNGAIYAPTANLSYSGGAFAPSTCTRLIAAAITLAGGSTASFNNTGCSAVAGPVLTASGVTGSGTPYTGAPMLVQ